MKVGPYQISLGNLDVKTRIILAVILLSITALPIVLLKDCFDDINLKKRGKFTSCKVIGLKGLKRNKAVVEYYVNNQRIEQVRSFPYLIEVHLGDKFKINYDSLNYENIQIMWTNQKVKELY